MSSIPYLILLTISTFLIVIMFFKVNDFSYIEKSGELDFSNEFNEIYDVIYKESFEKMEKLRIKYRKISVITAFFMSIFIILGLFAGIKLQNNVEIQKIVGYIAVASGGVACVIQYINDVTNRKKYAQEFKKDVISKLVTLINKDLNYIPEREKEKDLEYKKKYEDSEFGELKLDKACYEDGESIEINSGDYIEGYLSKDISLEMSKLMVIHTEKVRNEEKKTIAFRGVFSCTNCQKNTNRYIKIYLNKSKIIKNEELVNMDSKTFEEYFDIYSGDKVFAMRLLTHDVMELLIDFYKKYDIPFEISLKYEKIYIRFFRADIFEPTINYTAIDKRFLYSQYAFIKFILEVSEKINDEINKIDVV